MTSEIPPQLEAFSLKGKVVLITGATGVLGGEFCQAAAGAGARVAVLARNAEKIRKRVEELEAAGAEAIGLQADVLDEARLLEARTRLMDRWGRIDGLIHSAGGNLPEAVVAPERDLFSVKMEDLRRVIDLNLYGTMLPTQVFAEPMARQGSGSIVAISSLAAQRPLSMVWGYTVAKKAIEGYSEWMAVELPRRYGPGLRVNVLAPGVFLSEQNRSLLTRPDGRFTTRATQFVQHTPMGRLGEPSELRGAVVWLLSDASRFVNGSVIVVDGGFNVFSV